MRTSDPERERVAEVIGASIAQGALTPEEGALRLQAVRAATYRDELDAAAADLPLAQAVAGRPGDPHRGTGSIRAALLALAGAVAAFVSRHRTWSIVIALAVVASLVAVGLFADWGSHGGGGHDRGGFAAGRRH